MVLTATLGNLSVRIIIDSGANGNYASRNVERRLRKYIATKNDLYRLTLVDGSLTADKDGWVRNELK